MHFGRKRISIASDRPPTAAEDSKLDSIPSLVFGQNFVPLVHRTLKRIRKNGLRSFFHLISSDPCGKGRESELIAQKPPTHRDHGGEV